MAALRRTQGTTRCGYDVEFTAAELRWLDQLSPMARSFVLRSADPERALKRELVWEMSRSLSDRKTEPVEERDRTL